MRSSRLQAIVALLITLVSIALSACGSPAPTASSTTAVTAPAAAFTNISVQQLKAALDAKEQLVLLDVRTPEEYTGDGHVAGSVLIPVDQIQTRLGELSKATPIVCICRSGNRSQTACATLAANG
ncbi:MAG: rhodanese-like domain-containing protein, partial [Chloroflexales bacterium]